MASGEAQRALRHRGLGIKFRRQCPIGGHIADFARVEYALVAELDGGHHALPDVSAYDAERTRVFNAAGFPVLRFWNTEMRTNLLAATQTLQDVLHRTPLSPWERGWG